MVPTSPSTTRNLCFSKLLPAAHKYLHICTPWIGRVRVSSKNVLTFWHSLSFEQCVRFPVGALCDMKSCSHWISERQKLHSLFPEVVLTFTVPLAVARLLSRSFHLPRSRPTASVLQAAHLWGEKILDETNTKGIHQHHYQSHPTACVFEAAQVLVGEAQKS